MNNPNAAPETVRVKSPVSDDNPLGYVVINKDNLTDQHEVFEDAKAAAEPVEVAAAVTPSWQQK